MEIEQSASVNEKNYKEIVKENEEIKEKKRIRNRDYQRAWRQRKRDLKKKVSKEEKEEKKRKRHRENQRAYYHRKKSLKENYKNVELFPKKLDDLQMKRERLDSNEDQENVRIVQCRASQTLENVQLEQNEILIHPLHTYEVSHFRGAVAGSMSLETVRVKEETVCTDAGCGVSAAAARAGLYAGHAVKDELVIGSELLQPPDAIFAAQGGTKVNVTWKASDGNNVKSELKTVKQEPEDFDVEEHVSIKQPALPELGAALSGQSMPAYARKQLTLTCLVGIERLRALITPHQCHICHQSFDMDSGLTTHMNEMHNNSTVSRHT